MIASALGSLFGGFGSLANSAFQIYGNERLQDHAYSLNQESLRESPSNYREGLLKAGYNPMLVMSSGVPTPSVGASGISSPDIVTSAMQGAKAVADVKSASAEAEIAKADASSAQEEADARKAEAKLDAVKADYEREALEDDDYSVEVDGKDSHPTRSDYKQMIKNDIQRRRYTNSREHAISEDAINALHGGSSAYQSWTASRANRARERSFRRR